MLKNDKNANSFNPLKNTKKSKKTQQHIEDKNKINIESNMICEWVAYHIESNMIREWVAR
jgi:hypothetical protein